MEVMTNVTMKNKERAAPITKQGILPGHRWPEEQVADREPVRCVGNAVSQVVFGKGVIANRIRNGDILYAPCTPAITAAKSLDLAIHFSAYEPYSLIESAVREEGQDEQAVEILARNNHWYKI